LACGRDAQGSVQERRRRQLAEQDRLAPDCFFRQAEFTRTLTKGSYVMVQGAVRTREYERDGVKHRIVEVRADTIGKLDRAERRAEAEGDPDAGDA
jgi:single-stranded DNA-binding protein